MADKSPIEWTDATWNPIVGCSIVSPGCTNCYAMKMAGRIEAMGGAKHYAGTTRKVNGNTIWTGKLAMAPDHILTQPLAWRAPRRIFVNSMGDLFHEDVPDEWIDKVFAIMALAPQHTFQVLTKRAKRMREYITRVSKNPIPRLSNDIAAWMGEFAATMPVFAQRSSSDIADDLAHRIDPDSGGWPLRNAWLGVSAERQQEADERIPELLATPAAVRFVSAEPLLGPIDFTWITGATPTYGYRVDALSGRHTIPSNNPTDIVTDGAGLDWIIAGGESGPDARPMHPAWPQSIRDLCHAAGVPFFFKQWGAWAPGEWALDLDDRCQFSPLDPAVPVHGLGDHDRAQHRVHWWEDDKVPEGLGSLRIGKKASGRLLDGIEHNAMPEAR